ncbi:DUF2167 domain-containing protein [Oleiharenicola lentus]|uniref:DUF2167 domain-containing protein n=1 Tax=Oleiharenicola lentus TaxID=2508720 RepID=UPI003F667A0C
MHTLRLVFVQLALVSAVFAADPKPETTEAPPKTRQEAFTRAGVKLTSGPATVALGSKAEIKLPEGYAFVGPDSLDRFYELTRNSRSGNEVGVLLAPNDWMLFFDYDDVGYVKDDEKDKLDAEKLMKSMTEGQEAANSARKERGWDEMKLNGWATQPHYDTKTNHLKWAITLSSSQDNYKEPWINENIRLLGRGGVMNVTLVSDTSGFKTAELEADTLLAQNFSYVQGEKYAEFKQGDKVAAYGLAALVLGGGAAAAAKLGLLAKFGIFFGKFWKFIVGGLVALWMGIKKIMNKVTGSRPQDPAP